jgi:hypothetical protein
MQSQTFHPLREVPPEHGNFGCIDDLLTSTKVCNLKKELKSFLEDTLRVMDQLDPQFLDLQIYTKGRAHVYFGDFIFWGGETMIRRTAMVAWGPACPEVEPAHRKFPLEDPHWNINDPANKKGDGGFEKYDQ